MNVQATEISTKDVRFYIRTTLTSRPNRNIFQSRQQIIDRARHRVEIRIIFFRNLNAVHLPKFHHDIQKVHAVQFHLLAERAYVIQIGEILVRSTSLQNFQNHLPNLI